MKVKSPLISSGSTTLIKTYSTSSIIKEYNSFFGIDVSKYFKATPSISLYHCQDTGYQFYYPFNINGDEEFYKFFENKYDWYYQENKWEYDKVLRTIDFSHKKVLEVGCGNGYFLDKVQLKNASIVEGIEFNSTAVKYCKIKKLKVFEKDVSEIDKNNYYDIICTFQVLEHISDVNNFLYHCCRLLKQGGKLIIAVPNNDSLLFSNQNNLSYVNPQHKLNCLLNMPPHHMGRWNLSVFKNLDFFFPLTFKKSYFEPILNDRNHYLTLLNKKDNLLKKVKFRLIQPYIKGHSILVIFEKKI